MPEKYVYLKNLSNEVIYPRTKLEAVDLTETNGIVVSANTIGIMDGYVESAYYMNMISGTDAANPDSAYIDGGTMFTLIGGYTVTDEIPPAIDASHERIPSEYSVRSAIDALATLGPALTPGAGIQIETISGQTGGILSVAGGNGINVATAQQGGVSVVAGTGITVDSNGVSVNTATNNSFGGIAGATNGVTLINGVAQFDLSTAPIADGSTVGIVKSVGDGLVVEGGTASVDDATVAEVLEDQRIEGSTTTVSPVEDRVVTPGNLRGALSVGQAVDVSCAGVSIGGNTGLNPPSGYDFLDEFDLTAPNAPNDSWCSYGFDSGFPKFADNLKYLFIVDIKNISTVALKYITLSENNSGWGVPGAVVGVPFSHNNVPAQESTYTRIACICTHPRVLFRAAQNTGSVAEIKIAIKNWRQYEVTALTDEAIAYLAQLPDPDAFFRSASVYSLRDKYLVKQDMVCPFIPTINMPDNSNLTVAAGLSYKIKYTNDNTHTITADTIPIDAYGWDTHVQMFIKGTSSIVFQHPLILMDALTPNAGHNLSIKWRNGDALVYVDDTNAGNIVISATCSDPSVAGELQYFLLQNPGSGQENYIIFAATTDGITCDAGTVSVAYNTDIIGNGTDKTAITGTLSVAGSITMNAQSLMITGSTINGPTNAYVVLDNVALDNTTVDIKNIYLKTVVIPAGSTVYRTNSDAAILTEGTSISGGGTLDLCSLPAIYRNSATATLRMSDISVVNGYRNSSRSVGGLYFVGCGKISIVNCYVSNMSGVYGGATQFNDTPTEISGCTFTQCSAGIGPAIYYVGNTHTLTDCVITGNTGNYQHSISLKGATGRLFMSNCAVTGNTRSQTSTGSCNIGVDGGSELTITGSTVDEHLSVDTSKLNIEGYNHFLGHVRAVGNTSVVTVKSGSIIDFTDAIAVGGYLPGIVTHSQKPLYVFGDNITIVKTDGGTVAFDAWTSNTGNSVYASGIITFSEITITGSTVDPWKAENVTFYSKIDAHEVNTMKLTNDTFARGSLISAPPARIQLPAGTTVSMSGNTNSSDTKILDASLIVVGDNPASPSGTATVVNASGTSSTVTGIGTYIDKEGDNDFVANNTTNVKAVDGSTTGAKYLGTVLSATTGETGANKFAKIDSGAVAVVNEATNAVNKQIITHDYEPIIGGTFSLTSATVNEATKTVAIQSGGTMTVVDIRGGKDSVIDLGGSAGYLANAPCFYGGVTITGGTAAFGPAGIASGGATATISNCVISANTAGNAKCGAFHATGANFFTISSSTLAGNTGYGLSFFYTPGLVKSCVFSDNTRGAAHIAGNTSSIVEFNDNTFDAGQNIVLSASTPLKLGNNTLKSVVSGSSGFVTITSGATIDLTGNTNDYPVAPGGGITFASGGATVLVGSGTASSSYMMDNVNLPAGAKLTNTAVVNMGGTGSAACYGSASGATLTSGFFGIHSGGVANNTMVSRGILVVYSGGVLNEPTISSGGSLVVSSGGSALLVTSNTGAVVTVAEGGYITYK